jgi:hypothetical protein
VDAREFEDVPVAHLVHLVEDDQARPRAPGLPDQHPAVVGNIPVEVLGPRIFRHQRLSKRGLADLPGAREKDHLAAEAGPRGGIEVALHSDYFL